MKKGLDKSRPFLEIYKPDPVSISITRLGLLSFIYATYPPGWASSPQAQVYMVLQPKRFTQIRVTSKVRELLPHVFTLTTPGVAVFFLWHFLIREISLSAPSVS